MAKGREIWRSEGKDEIGPAPETVRLVRFPDGHVLVEGAQETDATGAPVWRGLASFEESAQRKMVELLATELAARVDADVSERLVVKSVGKAER